MGPECPPDRYRWWMKKQREREKREEREHTQIRGPFPKLTSHPQKMEKQITFPWPTGLCSCDTISAEKVLFPKVAFAKNTWSRKHLQVNSDCLCVARVHAVCESHELCDYCLRRLLVLHDGHSIHLTVRKKNSLLGRHSLATPASRLSRTRRKRYFNAEDSGLLRVQLQLLFLLHDAR